MNIETTNNKEKCPNCCNSQDTKTGKHEIHELARKRIIMRLTEELVQEEFVRQLTTLDVEQLSQDLQLPLDTLQPIIDRLKNRRNLH